MVMQKLLALGSLQKCTSHEKRQSARMQGRLVINYSLGWGMVNGACRWVVVATCGQWILAGVRSRAVGGHGGCHLCRSIDTEHPLGVAVAGCRRCWLGGAFVGGMVVFMGGRFMGGQRCHGQMT